MDLMLKYPARVPAIANASLGPETSTAKYVASARPSRHPASCNTISSIKCPSGLFSPFRPSTSLPVPAPPLRKLTVHATVSNSEAEAVPVPVVLIDQHTEEDATVVQLEFGDRLGALSDTIAALQALGLNVVKGKVTTVDGVGRNTFVITQNGTKVQDAGVLEAIRGTIISNLLQYHPESKSRLAMARGRDKDAAAVFARADISTTIILKSIENGKQSELYVETADYPGLLLDIVHELKYLSVDVSSAEIDTEGLAAKDHFYVIYHGSALDEDMATNVKNALLFFLDKRDIEGEESY